MKAYLINLQHEHRRRENAERIIESIPFLDCQVIDAIHGGELSPEEIAVRFDLEKFRKTYRRDPQPGEVGCTLSHIKSFNRLIDSEEPYAVVFEDDIREPVGVEHLETDIAQAMALIDEPAIVLLSGGYMFDYRVMDFSERELVNVYYGYFAHAYVVNRAAAAILTSARPGVLIDDWLEISRLGIRVLALRPHIFDQDDEEFESSIDHSDIGRRVKWSFADRLRRLALLVRLRILRMRGFVENRYHARHN